MDQETFENELTETIKKIEKQLGGNVKITKYDDKRFYRVEWWGKMKGRDISIEYILPFKKIRTMTSSDFVLVDFVHEYDRRANMIWDN